MAIGVLHVVGGNDRGKQFPLGGSETRIGRGTDQDVVLSDIAVSRRHFTVTMSGPRYQINDLGSGNGTLVNGQRVNTAYLNDGDHIEIGNTVMRFNQAMDASAGPPGGYVPPAAYPPPGGPPVGGGGGLPAAPPGYSPPPAYPPSPANYPVAAPLPPAQQPNRPLHGAMTQTPQMVGQATMAPAPAPARPAPQATMAAVAPAAAAAPRAASPAVARRSPPPASSAKRGLWYGSMALVWIASGAVVASKTVLAKPEVVISDGEESYRQGVRLFTGSQFADAKVAFADAVKKAPDAADAKRYLAACDVELQAQRAMQHATQSISAHQYLDAMNALEEIDSSSQLYEQARRQRRDQGPKAALEELANAEKLAQSNSAQALIEARAALDYDPNNMDAQRLVVQLRGSSSAPVAVVHTAAPVAAPHEASKEHSSHHSKVPDAPPIPMAKLKSDAPVAAGGASLPEIKAAFAAYKSKDFTTAANLVRTAAVSQPASKSDRLIAVASDLTKLQSDPATGASDETNNPDAAVSEYNDALAIDARDGKGTHAAFIRGRLGKAQLGVANTRFKQGKYDQAMALLQSAQKSGIPDSIGLGKQLDAKANELLQKGQGLAKSNPAQAKTYFRQVMKMVPVGSPTYTNAYKLVNTTGAPKRDEDED